MKVYKRARARESVQTLDSRILLESRTFELDPEIEKISENSQNFSLHPESRAYS